VSECGPDCQCMPPKMVHLPTYIPYTGWYPICDVDGTMDAIDPDNGQAVTCAKCMELALQ
jgi:hypothetical protein